MPLGNPLPPDEVVYRRIAEKAARDNGWIKGDKVDLAAFLPNKGDTIGLSLTRAPDAAAAGALAPRGKRVYMVRLRVRDMAGMEVRETSSTHAVIAGWTFATRGDDVVRNGAEFLTTICGTPEGPFLGEFDPTSQSVEQ